MDTDRPQRPEPVLGWRIWKLRAGGLASWAIDYRWEPGTNRACCLTAEHRACVASPGRHCMCGFWAVWSPLGCVSRAYGTSDPADHVMGLIAGWGEVALHGREGFRAERASVVCLFTDWPWRGLRGLRGGFEAPEVNAARTARLRAVAARFGVPLLGLRAADRLGVLGEWGVPRAQVEEAVRLADPTRPFTP